MENNMELKVDTTTKILLGAIALGLFLNAFSSDGWGNKDDREKLGGIVTALNNITEIVKIRY